MVLRALVFTCVAGIAACGPSGTRIPITDTSGSGGHAGAGGTGGESGSGGTSGAGGAGGIDPEPIGTGGSGGVASGGAGGQGTGGTPSDTGGAGGGGGSSPPDATIDVAVIDMRPPAPDVIMTIDVPPEAPPSTLTMGLISHWALEEGTGTAAADSAGQNPGTLNNGPTWIMPGFAAISKAALHFDGSDDFVELGVANLPANNKPQTVAFWLRYAAPPSGDTAGVAVSLTAGSGTSARLKLGLRRNNFTAWKSAGDTLVETAVGSSNAWHHFVYSFDGTNNRLYIDGVEKARSTTAPDTSAVSNARIGAIYNNAESFAGDIDELRIYGRALSAAEVLALSKGDE
jgi:hypothetical protein